MKRTPILALCLTLFHSTLYGEDACVSIPIAIPDNMQEGIAVQMSVDAGNKLVESIALDLEILHDWVGDLRVILQSPSGTMCTILDRPGIPSVGFPGPFGCGGDNILASFYDDATQNAELVCVPTLPPALSGEFFPQSPMGIFSGEPASGVWNLLIADLSPYDAGTFMHACIRIETTQPPCGVDLDDNGELDIFDVFAFIDAFNTQSPPADFFEDGIFDIFDVVEFLTQYNAGCP